MAGKSELQVGKYSLSIDIKLVANFPIYGLADLRMNFSDGHLGSTCVSYWAT